MPYFLHLTTDFKLKSHAYPGADKEWNWLPDNNSLFLSWVTAEFDGTAIAQMCYILMKRREEVSCFLSPQIDSPYVYS